MEIAMTQKNLERELKKAVESWQNKTFNFIQLEVVEKVLDNMLFEHIVPKENLADYVEDYFHDNLSKEEQFDIIADVISWAEVDKPSQKDINEYLLEVYKDEVRSYMEDTISVENYPIWNTLFEFREIVPQEWLNKAQEFGIGLVERTEYFNNMLFMTSCGHSFYSSYWIPLYLSIFEREAEKYKGVDYQHL